jgi:hypothetical protein
MYLAPLKTMLVEALKETFDEHYPVADLRGVHVSIEYPIEKMHYPGIWVDYDDVEKLRIAGVDHKEYDEVHDPEGFEPFTRWKFSGYASYTVTALTSWERDRLYDELVTTFAFGRQNPDRSRFRRYIEDNDFIAANFDFDEIEPRGNVAAPGTPWGTDEIIYERTVNMEIIGEFVADNDNGTLLPLSQIILIQAAAQGLDDPPVEQITGTVPNPLDSPVPNPLDSPVPSPLTSWH